MTSRNKGDSILLLMLGIAMIIWLANGLREVINHHGSIGSLIIVGHIAFAMEAYDSGKLGKFFVLMLMAVVLSAVKLAML
jgi:hypothetical protein